MMRASEMVSSETVIYRRLFWILVIILLIVMPILSQDFGITWDEWVHSYFGKLILRYFLTGGADKTCLTTGGELSGNLTLNLYGHLFDTLSTIVFGIRIGSITNAANQDLHWTDFYETRHACNAFVGFLAILLVGLLARDIAGERAGFLALLFMAISPCFLGHSMNNPKDIPFAATYIFGVYYLVKFLREYPKPTKKTMGLLALAIALSINVRIGGIILIAYLILFSGIFYLRSLKEGKEKPDLKIFIRQIVIISLAGYFGGLIFWPYGHINPFVNPMIALKEMSNYTALVLSVLFEGRMVLSNQLPWYYIPKWIWITTPIAVLFGGIVCLAYFYRLRRFFRIDLLSIVLFSAFFPVIYSIIRKTPLYDGWRHLLFVYPSLVVLAALGWDFLFRILEGKWQKISCLVLLLVLISEPIQWMVLNHPNEYNYFNPLVGGLKGAYGNYELDYWGNSLREGSVWLADYIKKSDPRPKVVVWADGSPSQTAYYLKAALGDRYIPYQPAFGENGWDYGMGLTRKWQKRDLRSEAFPPRGTIHTVNSGSTILSVVVKNPDRTI